MAIQHDKSALLAALRKPALSKPQVEEIMSQATIPAAKPPTPPQHVSPWRIGKEAMGLLADGLAAYSTVIRPLIPRTFGHPVHGDPATDSMNIRPAIPR